MKSPLLATALIALSPAFLFAQEMPVPAHHPSTPAPENHLTVFDLDFPGGTPRELAAAIEKATSRPLNVIIPLEYADTRLPPLKMSRVDTAHLFQALQRAMILPVVAHNVPYTVTSAFLPGENPSYNINDWKGLTDDTVWVFVHNGLPSRESVTRFYSLAGSLQNGLTVDDVVTAVKTAWQMHGVTQIPKLSFHKETNLLIADGDPAQVEMIDGVLNALAAPRPPPPADGKKSTP